MARSKTAIPVPFLRSLSALLPYKSRGHRVVRKEPARSFVDKRPLYMPVRRQPPLNVPSRVRSSFLARRDATALHPPADSLVADVAHAQSRRSLCLYQPPDDPSSLLCHRGEAAIVLWLRCGCHDPLVQLSLCRRCWAACGVESNDPQNAPFCATSLRTCAGPAGVRTFACPHCTLAGSGQGCTCSCGCGSICACTC
jgi:hypothetical protein